MNQTMLPSPNQEHCKLLGFKMFRLTSNKVHEAAYTFERPVEFYNDAAQMAERVTRDLAGRLAKLALQQEKLKYKAI